MQFLKVKYPSPIEYLLIIWILSFILDEMRQFFLTDNEIAIKKKLVRYLRDQWNYLDIMGCFFFSIAMILRIVSLFTTIDLFIAAR